MTKTLEERIALMDRMMDNGEFPLFFGIPAQNIIRDLQAENQALQKKLDEALGRVEIQEKAMKDAIYCKEYYSDPATAIKVAVKDLENALVKLNKQGVENDE